MSNRSAASPTVPESLEYAMALASTGDRGAFERVFQVARDSVVRLVMQATRNNALADDVAQETLIKVWNARASYQAGMPVLPWIRTIARRTMIDTMRRQRLERKTCESSRRAEDATEPRVEEVIDARRVSDRTMEALRGLPPRQADALLAAATEVNLSDLARRAGDSPLAMRLRVHRARAALRKSLGVLFCAAAMAPVPGETRFSRSSWQAASRQAQH